MARRMLAKGDLAIEEAMEEVRSKTGEEVDDETAFKWAARSIASYRLCQDTDDIQDKVERFSEGDDYRHEALEHAGTGGNTETLARVARETNQERDKALRSFK